MTKSSPAEVVVRNLREDDVDRVIELCQAVYRGSPPWSKEQLASHLRVFPEGQFVAEEVGTGRLLGYAASLIVRWDDYDFHASWREFTDAGYFTNHDPARGRTLYGAEVMVHPDAQGRGIGKKLYEARFGLAKKLKLLRIRAGARLRGFSKHADKMLPIDYVQKVIGGELSDPTLTFQLKRGFHVCALVRGYLRHDPESLGYAALIEWINDEVATPADSAAFDPRFACSGVVQGQPLPVKGAGRSP